MFVCASMLFVLMGTKICMHGAASLLLLTLHGGDLGSFHKEEVRGSRQGEGQDAEASGVRALANCTSLFLFVSSRDANS